jgi:anion-transporting  ArsA/GET3 family ATPase
MPIYHVHGFVPLREGRESLLDEIVLSEDQYNRAAQDPYTWQNLVQMQALSETISVMVGLSLTDRNLRRILDNLRAMPRRNRSYALLKRPPAWDLGNEEVAAILKEMKERVRTGFEFGYDEQAVALLDRPAVHERIVSMIRDLQSLDLRRQEETVMELGVTVIWYESHEDVAKILGSIVPRGL